MSKPGFRESTSTAPRVGHLPPFLHDLRRRAGVSLGHVAALAGVHLQNVHKAEFQPAAVSAETARRIAVACQATPDDVERCERLSMLDRGAVPLSAGTTEVHVRAVLALLALPAPAVGRVLRAIERERARAKGEEASDGGA